MQAPILSVVVAVYNVEDFVPATLKSFERQFIDQSLVEYVFVDDGSTDRSLEIIQAWSRQRKNATVISQENQGAGAARKTALERVVGTWVTVVDPDDIVGRNYFSSILNFIERDSTQVADMLVTKVLVLNGETGRAYDTHPLGYRFKHGSRLVALQEEPTCIQLGATAVLRVERLKENNLTYDTRIEPTFEDAHLLGRYLATTRDPVVGIVADAKYYYRKRPDQSSLVQSSWSEASRYSTVLNLGYLNMLESIQAKLGYVPVWAQNMVLYDLVWYFKEETQQHSKTAWISGELRDEFLQLLMKIFDLLDVAVIEEFSVNPIWWSMRQTILGFFKRTYALNNRIVQWGENRSDGSNQYCILTFGAEPVIQIFVNGLEVTPSRNDYTVHSYFGVPMMVERNITVGSPGRVRILSDGRKAIIERARTKVATPSRTSWSYTLAPLDRAPNMLNTALTQLSNLDPRFEKTFAKIDKISKRVRYVSARLEVESLALSEGHSKVLVRASRNVLSKSTHSSEQAKAKERVSELTRNAKSASVRKKYHNAWVIMDRPMRADDNGEHLYRFILNNRSDINAYYLLRKESPDWDRLAADGFKLVEYGSDESVLLLLNADLRMSSDAVAEVMYPISRKNFSLSGSKFVFLQHGVTKDDLSRWLNPKGLDGIVCATVDEYESIVGPSSPYTIKREQALLTGFPRFDRLHELADKRTADPDLILVMPTWRQYLRDELEACKNDAERAHIFNDSDFGKNWLEFLNSAELKETAQRLSQTIGFIAHPAFSSLIDHLDIPDHVSILDPAEMGFQNLLIRASVFITDYSSVAFDVANLEVPVVYFQFDPEVMFGGGHNFRKGYFDYETDGFGPVCQNAKSAVSSVYNALEMDDSMELLEYKRRVAAAFPYADNKNSERLVQALVGLIE